MATPTEREFVFITGCLYVVQSNMEESIISFRYFLKRVNKHLCETSTCLHGGVSYRLPVDH